MEWATEELSDPGLCEGSEVRTLGKSMLERLSLLSTWPRGWWFDSVNGLSPCCSAHSQGWRTGER